MSSKTVHVEGYKVESYDRKPPKTTTRKARAAKATKATKSGKPRKKSEKISDAKMLKLAALASIAAKNQKKRSGRSKPRRGTTEADRRNKMADELFDELGDLLG